VTRLLVTGAGGMLGSDLVASAAARELDVVAVTRGDLDISDDAAVRRAIRDHAPDVVINCAAWTRVDDAEADERSALLVNGDGAGNIARAAADAGAHLIQVSTDYVFDGTATRPYVESDATGPRTAYGRTKLAGEHAVLAASPGHAVVRTAWLFGRHGPNFVATMLRLAERGEVSVVTDQVGCPTFTGHLAEKLLDLAAHRRGGILHAAASGHCSWFEFARAIFVEAGLDVQVEPTTSEAYVRPAPRPAWSVLASERDDEPLPPWQDGLVAFLAARGALA
jgi:dTDP-4-dehydrorhamnose reductase